MHVEMLDRFDGNVGFVVEADRQVGEPDPIGIGSEPLNAGDRADLSQVNVDDGLAITFAPGCLECCIVVVVCQQGITRVFAVDHDLASRISGVIKAEHGMRRQLFNHVGIALKSPIDVESDV